MVGLVGLVVAIGATAVWLKAVKGGSEPQGDLATYAAQRGRLTISVLESGTIKAKDQIIIKNEVEGRRSIIFLVEEGTQVKEEDLLVELDSSSLKDSKVDQEILVQNASADLVDAQENLAITENQGKSDVDQARLTLEFARQDLEQYTAGDGLFARDVTELDAQISLAEEELRRAEDVNEWSGRLFEEKYISESEYMADKLQVKRKRLELDKSQTSLRILKKFTYERQISQLTSDVNQAEMAMERTLRKANANNTQAQARLNAKDAEYKRQQSKLDKIVEQIEKCRIKAPADGLVVYATSVQSNPFMNKEPLDEGQEVHERQELIYLPKTDSVLAEVDVHEVNLHKVKPTLPAIITLDALPGQSFFGTVRQIAPLPNASMPLAPDLKVYKAEVDLQSDGAVLRTGMSCRAEMIVAQYEDAVYVPVQTVLNVAGVPTVYVLEGDERVARKIKIGLDNNRMVHVKEGLEEGEAVLLAPPLDQASVESAPGADGAESSTLEAASDDMGQKVRDQLDTSAKTPAAPTPKPGGPEDKEAVGPRPGGPQRQGPGGQGMNLSPEQKKRIEKMRKIMENLTEEEKEQLKNMSQEDQMKFFREKMEKSP